MEGAPRNPCEGQYQAEPLIGLLDELSFTRTSDDVVTAYASWAQKIIECDRASVAIAHPEGESLEIIAIEGDGAVSSGNGIPITGTFIGRVYETRQADHLIDTSKNGRYPGLKAVGMRTAVVAPIEVRDRCFGCLTITSRDPSRFTPADVATLGVLARCLASYLLLHDRLDHVSELAMTDQLTQLYNRRFFHDAMENQWKIWKSRRRVFSLLTLDIDHFKSVNDKYGHLSGDEVLRNLAKILRAACRSQDYVCRMGGEEFAVILTDTPIENAARVAERIRREIAAHIIGKQRLAVTVSIGVASVSEHFDNTLDLSKHADEALYAAKSGGRNQVVVAPI